MFHAGSTIHDQHRIIEAALRRKVSGLHGQRREGFDAWVASASNDIGRRSQHRDIYGARYNGVDRAFIGTRPNQINRYAKLITEKCKKRLELLKLLVYILLWHHGESQPGNLANARLFFCHKHQW